VPKKSKPVKRRPLYKSPPPKPERGSPDPQHSRLSGRAAAADSRAPANFSHAHPIPPAHFELREDGSIVASGILPDVEPGFQPGGKNADISKYPENSASGPGGKMPPSTSGRMPDATALRLVFSCENPFLRLYHGNCLELLDAISARYPEGRFDAIFADPPYFLSNGGITCHAGRMVKVDKGDWDVSRGPELNHEFNLEWLARCQRVLKPNGTLWVSGTHHVIFSIGYALQSLGFKILNDIAWEKPNPPPNLSCRYFTHSTETILWAAKNDKSRHLFNYQEMRKVTGKQMKTVWREFTAETPRRGEENEKENLCASAPLRLDPIWTMTAPGNDEKSFGKHPTQKPVALVERCLLASTNENDLVLDPFLGNGTTAVAAVRLKRQCVGIELDLLNVQIAEKRVKAEIILIWLRHFRVRIAVSVFCQIDLDLFSDSINGSRCMADVPQIETERIFHECKFVFLSCAQVERGAVVHTTVDVSLQEAWAKTPNGKKRETTHVVRCETEIFRVKN
jgi:site-specific DNA-methyltransferase (adenine-specific)